MSNSEMDMSEDADEIDERLGRASTRFDPVWEAIILGVFGMTEREVIDHLGLVPDPDLEFKDHVSIYALKACNKTEIISARRLERAGRQMSIDECVAVVAAVARKVTPIFLEQARHDGVDFVSGVSLDKDGRALIDRQLRLGSGGK